MTLAPAQELVDRDEILRIGGPWKRSGEWLLMFCPAHADGSKHGQRGGQSLGLSDTGVLKCFAGCEFKDVIAALRGPNFSPEPRSIRTSTHEALVKVYQYKDKDGVVLAEKGRFESPDKRKSFRWRLPGSESWSGGVDLDDMPLYGVWKFREYPSTEPVYFVEGEKACEACWGAGLLAVTHGGGAGTKKFGQSLDVLRGREVLLWPDNDAPGAAHMTLVAAKLAVQGTNYRTISVPLPPKGDAYDYFAAGGTVEGITSNSPTESKVEILAEDSVRVTLPTVAGVVSFTFSEMNKRSRDFTCTVSVTCFSDPDPYTENLNLNSSSGKTQFRRDLDGLFGKNYDWTRNLNRAINLASEAYLTQERGSDIAEVPDSVGEVLLVPPLVVADGPTIFFGDGASLKSYITGKLMLCMSLGIDFCDMKTPSIVPMMIDYEDSGPNVKRRWKRIAAGMGLDDVLGIHYWDAKGIPLRDQVDAIRRYAQKHGIGLLVLDSAAPACGGDPSDHEAVIEFFNALKVIGLPCIIIAHVTKAGDTNKPFGSAFWHNEARRTWYIERVQEEDSDDVDIGFYNRKVNDGRKPSPLAFHARFSEDERGPVYINLTSMDRAPSQLLARTSPRQQVWSVLDKPMTAPEIAEVTGVPIRTVTEILTRADSGFVEAGWNSTTPKGGRPAKLWARLERFQQ